MEPLRITSVSPPFDSAVIAQRAVEMIARAEGMGLLGGTRIDHLDLPSFRSVVGRIAEAGIGREIEAALAAQTVEEAQLDRLLLRLLAALEDSPAPAFEWRSLVELFGHERLAVLTGTSPASVRRYLAGERETPDAVAARLHFLASIVGDLAGAYNDYGIRRWFERPRTALDERAPEDLLHGDWSPDGAEPRRVRELAASLAGSPAT
jgi:uncharacterized protein (DUF2384 family)